MIKGKLIIAEDNTCISDWTLKNMCSTNQSLHPYWLVFLVPEGTIQRRSISMNPAKKPVIYNGDLAANTEVIVAQKL